MVTKESIHQQLDSIGFNYRGWGRTEVNELHNIILPDEEIYECVNGLYEGGFALMLSTDVRVLLIDKKPLNFLTVEDLRFDMINEIDYNHRLIGAYIRISAGTRTFKFTALNQPRLRKLITHVQARMADVKKQQSSHEEGQHQHLEQINQQLQSYLLAQYNQQQKLYDQLQDVRAGQQPIESLPPAPEPVKPSRELADYLYAQSLMAQHDAQNAKPPAAAPAPLPAPPQPQRDQMTELYSAGMQEIFGDPAKAAKNSDGKGQSHILDPLRVAYGKLPAALHWRRIGYRPSTQVVPEPAASEA